MVMNQKIVIELEQKDDSSKLTINRKCRKYKDTINLKGTYAINLFDLVGDLIEINKNQAKEKDKHGKNKSM